jgi:hypothetical protein
VHLGGEAGDVADIGEDPGCPCRTDAGKVHQVRAAGAHGGGQLGLQCLERGFDAGQLGELVGDQPSPGASDLVTRPNSAEQSLVLGGGLLHRCPAGHR